MLICHTCHALFTRPRTKKSLLSLESGVLLATCRWALFPGWDGPPAINFMVMYGAHVLPLSCRTQSISATVLQCSGMLWVECSPSGQSCLLGQSSARLGR